MRNYLDGYINSLTKRERTLAYNFIWADRRALSDELNNIDNTVNSPGSRFIKVRPLNKVTSSVFKSIFNNTLLYIKALYDQCNNSANILTALEEQTRCKTDRIEAALKGIEQEVEDWEELLFSEPTASTVITRNFGTTGLRPIVETNGNLQLLSLVVQANADIVTQGGSVTAETKDKIVEQFFSAEEGLQVRLTYTFTPGNVDKIRLEPLSGAGSITIHQVRVYNSNGTLVTTLTSSEQLTRTLEYSIPKTIVSRVEVDLINSTFLIKETTSTSIKTGTRRVVIPAHQIKEEYTVEVPYNTTAITPTGSKYPYWNFSGDYLNIVSGDFYSKNRNTIIDAYKRYMQYSIYSYQYYSALWSLLNSNNSSNPANQSTKIETRYRWIDIPEQVLLEPYEYTESTITKTYSYTCGLSSIECSHNFYTDVMQYVEEVRFDNGIPSYITLTTDEFLPLGSYINLYLVCKDGQVIPMLPANREYTTDVLFFDNFGKATLNFNPLGPIYFYKDESIPVALQVNGKTVLGPSSNTGATNILGGTTYWVKYEGDQSKSNNISYTSRVGSYISKDGQLGEVYDSIPDSGVIVLEENPYIDPARLNDSSYSPVQIVVDGYTTVDLTNYEYNEEEEFPVAEEWETGVQKIHYKVRGKSIFFEKSVDRPVRIMYEYSAQYAKVLIEMGVIHSSAAVPVLYQYQMSYI